MNLKAALLAVLLMFAGVMTSCDKSMNEPMAYSQTTSIPLSVNQEDEEKTTSSSSWFNYQRWDVSPVASRNYFVGRRAAEIVVYNAGSIDLRIDGRWNNQVHPENFSFIVEPGTAKAVNPSGEYEMPYSNLRISVTHSEGTGNTSAGLAYVAVRYLQ